MPSAGPISTSVSILRSVRLTSATTTLRSRGRASSRVRTTTGRRPSSSSSSQRTSPRATTALRESPHVRWTEPRRLRPHRCPLSVPTAGRALAHAPGAPARLRRGSPLPSSGVIAPAATRTRTPVSTAGSWWGLGPGRRPEVPFRTPRQTSRDSRCEREQQRRGRNGDPERRWGAANRGRRCSGARARIGQGQLGRRRTRRSACAQISLEPSPVAPERQGDRLGASCVSRSSPLGAGPPPASPPRTVARCVGAASPTRHPSSTEREHRWRPGRATARRK